MSVLANPPQPILDDESLSLYHHRKTTWFCHEFAPNLGLTVVCVRNKLAADPTVAGLIVRGELDLATSPTLSDAIDQLLDSGVRKLTVDLSDLTFMDCSGLMVLITSNSLLQLTGGKMVLGTPRANIRRLLDITGLTASFNIEQSESDAFYKLEI